MPLQYTLLPAAQYQRMPWKNGLGVTSEVWREPGDAESFDWRVSIADIKENSVFSLFTGLQRVISTLEGAGMRLSVDGVWSEPLLKYDPFVFSGDSVTGSALLAGPIRDFNLIFNPRRCAARLQWLAVSRPQTFCTQAVTVLIFAAGETEVAGDGFSLSLSAQDSLLLRNEEAALTRIKLASPRGNQVCLIEITPKPVETKVWGPGAYARALSGR